jgi:exopolysaccharide biosynthesis protein
MCSLLRRSIAAGEGVDLYEFAWIMMEVGVYHGINVDGGGSTDAVLNGQVWSRPTCQVRV